MKIYILKKNITLFILMFFYGLLFSGCLSLEEMSISYDINKSLKGNLEIKFIGISSDEETEAEKKKEMDDFYKTYIEDGKEQIDIWCLRKGKTTLLEKTDVKCSALVTGEIHNFLGSLYPLTDDGDFEIKQNGQTFSLNIPSCKMAEDGGSLEISIKYEGRILSHNAHKFDKEKNLMTWTGKKMIETGIQFVLEIDE